MYDAYEHRRLIESLCAPALPVSKRLCNTHLLYKATNDARLLEVFVPRLGKNDSTTMALLSFSRRQRRLLYKSADSPQTSKKQLNPARHAKRRYFVMLEGFANPVTFTKAHQEQRAVLPHPARRPYSRIRLSRARSQPEKERLELRTSRRDTDGMVCYHLEYFFPGLKQKGGFANAVLPKTDCLASKQTVLACLVALEVRRWFTYS